MLKPIISSSCVFVRIFKEIIIVQGEKKVQIPLLQKHQFTNTFN